MTNNRHNINIECMEVPYWIIIFSVHSFSFLMKNRESKWEQRKYDGEKNKESQRMLKQWQPKTFFFHL